MPTVVTELLSVAGCESIGVVRWSERVPLDSPGVYLIARTADPDGLVRTGPPPIAAAAIDELLAIRPELRVNRRRPNAQELLDRISGFWLPDEPVVYIGLAATSVRQRVGAYYGTALGARKPHAGGWFLKLLADLDDLYVHFGAVTNPGQAEDDMLRCFCKGVSDGTRVCLHDPERPFPFANLEWPKGTRKRHGITGAKAPKPAASG